MTYLRGIDVSLWQSDAFEASNLPGCSFCIVKVSQAGFIDSSAPSHIATAKKAGVVVGGYHFLDPEPPAATQAQVFLAHADECEFLAVDVEGQILARGMTFAQDMAQGFIGYVKTHDPKHRKVLMYSSRGTWPGLCGADAAWVADYDGDPNRSGVSPRIRWTFWQYGGTGIDRDYFAGSQADLFAFAGRTVQQETTVKFATAYDPPKSVAAPTGTVISDFAGNQISKLSTPTHLETIGLADAHSGQFVVRISTAKFYADGQKRPTWAIAAIPGGEPQ